LGDGHFRAVSRVWPIAFACFTALALLFTGQVWVDYAYAGRRLTWSRALLVALVDWELWAIVAPAIVWLADRFRFARDRWGRALAVHLPVGIVTGAAKLVVEAIVIRALLGQGRAPFSFLKIYLTLLTYWSIVAAAHLVRQYRAARVRELRAVQLEAELARAQVEALKMQLHPHFLFNTLNTIAGLMREDLEAADLMLAKLAELLRHTFETADIQELPLDRELEFLDTYLTIQRTRYGERLRLSVTATEDARKILVPSLILQPLLENAIRHGIAEKPGPGRVDLDARIADGRLVITITNDGPGLPTTIREGYGICNTRSRLQALYGPLATFSLIPQAGGGAKAVLQLPAHDQRSSR
jgi:two-component system LytT family sensor kinase